MNKAILIGNLGTDVELRQAKNGRAVANLSLATHRVWYEKDQNGNRVIGPDNQPVKHKETQWHKVVVFGPQAERCAQYLRRGSKISVEGRIEYSEFTGQVKYAANKQVVVDGNNQPIQCLRYSTEIVADPNGVEFLDKAPQNQAYTQPQQGQFVQPQQQFAGPVNAPVQPQNVAPQNVQQAFTGQPQGQFVQPQQGQFVQPQNAAPQFQVNNSLPQGV